MLRRCESDDEVNARRTRRLLSEDGAPFDRTQLYTVITRLCELGVMSERHASVLEEVSDCSGPRDDDDGGRLAHPYGRLVCAEEAVYGGVGVVVGSDRDVVLASLWHPAGHCERRSGGRDHSTRGVRTVARISDETGPQPKHGNSAEERETHGFTQSTAAAAARKRDRIAK
jgi:hypothetical protein